MEARLTLRTQERWLELITLDRDVSNFLFWPDLFDGYASSKHQRSKPARALSRHCSQLNDVCTNPQFVQVISPRLHHQRPLCQELRTIVGAA